ncbi:twin-arginine translocation signal domain-containing protein [Rhodococcus sp. 1R11]|nr:twin-arginine translocation signal domain-containing protein [Rhodococcus sp. 1R11]
MAGLSRRQFVTRVGTLAAAWGIAPQVLGHALVARAQPASGETDVGGTLAQTILRSSTGPGRYRVLAAGPGEPYVPRLDILGRAPSASRVQARRSLLYLGHLSDMHVIDA